MKKLVGINMRIAVCDDENKIRQDIAGKVGASIPESEVSLFLGGQELIREFESSSFDIVLLDIDMPEISGLDVAGMIQTAVPKPLIIFVTSHDELVYDSLRFHPFGFVRKTHLDEELDMVLKDAVEDINSREKSISVHTAQGDVRLKLKDILYFESDGNYIKVMTADEELRFRDTMQTLEATLQYAGFIRVHKGFLVNAEAVKIYHLMVILSYLNDQDPEEAKKYISQILNKLNAVHSYIETGNSLMNHILNEKLSLARDKGIDIKAEVENLEFSKMESVDFSALLTNMLDNAIEA